MAILKNINITVYMNYTRFLGVWRIWCGYDNILG